MKYISLLEAGLQHSDVTCKARISELIRHKALQYGMHFETSNLDEENCSDVFP